MAEEITLTNEGRDLFLVIVPIYYKVVLLFCSEARVREWVVRMAIVKRKKKLLMSLKNEQKGTDSKDSSEATILNLNSKTARFA